MNFSVLLLQNPGDEEGKESRCSSFSTREREPWILRTGKITAPPGSHYLAIRYYELSATTTTKQDKTQHDKHLESNAFSRYTLYRLTLFVVTTLSFLLKSLIVFNRCKEKNGSEATLTPPPTLSLYLLWYRQSFHHSLDDKLPEIEGLHSQWRSHMEYPRTWFWFLERK